MIDQQLKKKIVNTISQYENKCTTLQTQITNLYNFISSLITLAKGIDDAIDEKFTLLQSELSQEKPTPEIVNASIQTLSGLISTLKSKTTHPLETITPQVNHSLSQLIEHLSIPDELSVRLESLKVNLQNELDNEKLIHVLDNLTALVTEAFNFNQNRFNEFLRDITAQLSDFESYLKQSTANNSQTQKNTEALETGIQGNIQEIQIHLDTSKTLEELSMKVGANLAVIGKKMRDYRETETRRIQEYEAQINRLQQKLESTEKQAELVKHTLSVQKSRIYLDSLTGLANRASFDELMQSAYDRWKLGNGELAIAIADIDHFKKINDSYGHHAGDKVLKKVAAIFKSSIRTTDFIARYGGEEFIFIFENTPSEGARQCLESLRVAVEKYQFCYRDNPVIVTLSFGLASIREHDNIESLFIRADQALYAAKNAGRNRVESL